MQVTNVKIRKIVPGDTPLKAVVSITLDNQLAVHEIKIVYANNRYFIVMPSKMLHRGEYLDYVHPINQEFRKIIEDAVLGAYEKFIAEAELDAVPAISALSDDAAVNGENSDNSTGDDKTEEDKTGEV